MTDDALQEAISTWNVIESAMAHIIREEAAMSLRERYATPEQFKMEKQLVYKRSLDKWQRIKAAYLENRDNILKHKSDIIKHGEMNYAKFRQESISYIDMLELIMQEEMEKQILF